MDSKWPTLEQTLAKPGLASRVGRWQCDLGAEQHHMNKGTTCYLEPHLDSPPLGFPAPQVFHGEIVDGIVDPDHPEYLRVVDTHDGSRCGLWVQLKAHYGKKAAAFMDSGRDETEAEFRARVLAMDATVYKVADTLPLQPEQERPFIAPIMPPPKSEAELIATWPGPENDPNHPDRAVFEEMEARCKAGYHNLSNMKDVYEFEFGNKQRGFWKDPAQASAEAAERASVSKGKFQFKSVGSAGGPLHLTGPEQAMLPSPTESDGSDSEAEGGIDADIDYDRE